MSVYAESSRHNDLLIRDGCITEDSVKKFRELTVKDYGKLLLPYGTLLLCAAFFRPIYPNNWYFHEFVIHLLDAFMIAGTLGILVELGSANRLIYEVGNDLVAKIAGRGLPEDLQGQIRQIINASLIRENSVKRYRLTESENGEVCVEIALSFDVKNYSDDTVYYAPVLSEEIFYHPEFSYLEYTVGGKGYSFNKEQLRDMVTTISETKVKNVEGPNQVKILPYKNDDKRVCKVRWQYQLRMPESYSDITSFYLPALGIRLELQSKPSDFEFTSAGACMEHIGNTWTFKRSFIQGQHVRVWVV